MLKKIVAKAMFSVLSIPMLILPVKSVKAAPEEIKVLSIGHSYSLNSCEYLYDIAKSQGVEMTIGIAFRGNCRLKDHYQYLNGDVPYGKSNGGGYYQKYVPGGHSAVYEDEYTLKQILADEKWDYIIFQDCLNTAGDYDVVSEWLSKLYANVKDIMRQQQNTDVQYIYHAIWGMESIEHNPDSKEKAEFANYNYDSEVMYKAVRDTSAKIAKDFQFRLIPNADAFELARNTSIFNVSQGGKILVADSTNHANDYGKYLAGITWFETITQIKVDKETVYRPDKLTEDEAFTLIDSATQAVEQTGLKLNEAKVEQITFSEVPEEEESKDFSTVLKIVGGIVFVVAIVILIIVIVKKRGTKLS